MRTGTLILNVVARLRAARPPRLGEVLGGGALLLVFGAATALAQGAPWYGRAPQRDPVCVRLEAQLAALDRTASEANAEQARRAEEAVNRQQAELDRLVASSRRMGCERTGFFLFGGGQPPQCDQVRGQIDRTRADLDRAITMLEQARGGGVDRGEQRQAILIALAQNACGPQYQNVRRPRGFFESLFGNAAPEAPAYPGTEGMPGETQPSGLYRTVCVRKCDGSFFPISYATTPARFGEDEQACHRACPATEVELYAYRNPGEDIAQATSISGRPYTELPNAFRYRREYDPACTCKRPGESWAAAVREDPTIARGDIVVTDETAKAMSQPKAPPASKPARSERPRGGAPPAPR